MAEHRRAAKWFPVATAPDTWPHLEVILLANLFSLFGGGIDTDHRRRPVHAHSKNQMMVLGATVSAERRGTEEVVTIVLVQANSWKESSYPDERLRM